MKTFLKLLLFTELLAIIVCGAVHLSILLFTNDDFPLRMYWICPLIVLAIDLFAALIAPLAEKLNL